MSTFSIMEVDRFSKNPVVKIEETIRKNISTSQVEKNDMEFKKYQ